MDTLIHPSDLDAWHRWEDAQLPLGARLHRWAGVLQDIARPDSRAGQVVVTRGGPDPRLLVCLESLSPTSVKALLHPLRDVHPEQVAVVAPVGVRDLLPPWTWTERTGLSLDLVPPLAADAGLVLSTGHSRPLGRAAQAAVDPHRFVTVQHGLLTPHAAPLAPGTTLLAWSEADAQFWRSGREDVTSRVVGSQLLWEAAEPPPADVDPQAHPVFLGQLHASELPRGVLTRAAEAFCLAEHATYRPHPSERDRRALATHARWEAKGIAVDRSGIPLHELGAPVVSVFSAGVLEAAAAGLPAWVALTDPPQWLRDFWTRYGMAEWGGPPTAPPEHPGMEPSRAVADALRAMMDR